ncbi:unnamed protein product [Coccothraustes coccothraustes]
MQALRKGEDAYLELSGAKGRSQTVFSRSRALESTGTGTMLSGRRSRFFASANRRARPLLRRFLFNTQMQKTRRSSREVLGQFFRANTVSPCEKIGKTFGENAGAPTSRRRISGAPRSEAPVPDGFQLKPRFEEHRHWHQAQCAMKPLLRLREPESAAAAET